MNEQNVFSCSFVKTLCSCSFVYTINKHKRLPTELVHEQFMNVQFVYRPKHALTRAYFRNPKQKKKYYRLNSSSRNLASYSLLGGYLGNVEGWQGNGFVVKNCVSNSKS
ncbi:hypothetical protein HanIR_Chr03g0113951 [Helianthus annuus]|nr:hypothetical protein HanIR_Chr03g0113951 [Helianthus annuus]